MLRFKRLHRFGEEPRKQSKVWISLRQIPPNLISSSCVLASVLLLLLSPVSPCRLYKSSLYCVSSRQTKLSDLLYVRTYSWPTEHVSTVLLWSQDIVCIAPLIHAVFVDSSEMTRSDMWKMNSTIVKVPETQVTNKQSAADQHTPRICYANRQHQK